MIELTQRPIDIPSVLSAVQSPAAGAVVLFLGTVREFTGTAQTEFLEYTAFPEMAVVQMQQLEQEARAQFPLIEMQLVHRTGRLDLGEVSVAVAVSAAHRAPAFAAGQWLIDSLKQRVPIWKKEHYTNGTEEWQHPGVQPPDSPVPDAAP
ncbi:MAG: molybdenum cofactor biosynthesis protein MoaE [Planctomycetota bacterium]